MFSNLKQPFNTPNTGFGFSSNVTPNPFGQTAFGKTPSTGFGTPAPAFGQQSTALFGQSSQHGSLFASAAPTNTFGQTVNTQPTFGSGMFGNASSQPSGSGLFGSTNTSTFGQQNKTTGFGFGTNTANTGFGFGQSTTQVQPQQQSTGLFGQTTSNLFGQTSGFGTNTTNNQMGTAIKFTPVTGTDTMIKGSINQTISTRHHCITCMKEYENKSLEELRWEDYQINRKGPQQGAQPSGGLFGNMSQPVGAPLFGSGAVATSANTLFGQQENKSVFGQPSTATGFGQTTPAFGATPTSNTGAGLFGKPLTGFGTATTSSAFPFSSTAQTTNLFGSNTAAKPAFGVSSQPNSLFGQPGFGTQSTFGTFGTTTNQNVGLFNQNKTTPFSIMPTSTTNTFGTFAPPATQNTNSLFSGAKPQTGGFGSFGQTSTAPVFGQPTFGQANQGGLFNSSFNKTSTPLFGQTQTTNTLGTGLQMGQNNSLFGSNVNKPNTMFGNNLGLFNSGFGTNTNAGAFSLGGNPNQSGIPNQDQSHSNTEQQIISMSSTPYGIPSLLNNIPEVSNDLKDCTRPTNPSELNALLNTVAKSQSSTPAEKLKPVQVFGRKVPMFDGLEHRDESLISNIRINSNPKRLIVRNHPSKNKDSLDDSLIRSSNSLLSDKELTNISTKSITESSKEKESLYPDLRPLQRELSPTSLKNKKNLEHTISLDMSTSSAPISSTMITSPSKALFIPESHDDENDSRDEDPDLFAEASETQDWQIDQNDSIRGVVDCIIDTSNSDCPASSTTTKHPTGIILTRPEYYTVPSLDELVKFISEDGSCVVKGFTVGRYGYGNVYFSDAFDVSNLNLDELIHFRHKEINIYPDDLKKPPLGQGLNRRAQVTLDKVWPLDKKAKALIMDVDTLTKMDYAGRMRRLCEKQNTRFVEYRPATGSWVFKVEHFSKYGHRDSDDDEDLVNNGNAQNVNTQAKGTVSNVLNKMDSVKPIEDSEITAEASETTAPAFQTVTISSKESLRFGDVIYTCISDDERMFNNVDDHQFYESGFSMMNGKNQYSLMKSTLFEQDILDYPDNASDVCSSEGGILELSNYVSQSSPKRLKDDYDDVHIPESEIIPLDICEDEIPEPYSKPDIVPIDDSLFFSTEPQTSLVQTYHNFADMIAMKGKSFRVGWTKQLTMLCLTTDEFQDVDSVSSSEDYETQYRTIAFKKITNLHENAFQNLEEHLKCQFEHTCDDTKRGIRSSYTYYSYDKLHEHQKIARSLPNDNYEKQIWNLIGTLFDRTEQQYTEEPEDAYKFKVENTRQENLTEWIKSVVESTVENEVNSTNRDSFAKILSYISGNKLDEAAELAMNTNNANLSLLISQLPTNALSQEALRTQLSLWEKCDVYDFLDETILKIYAILAGTTMVKVKGKTILTYDEMDWIRIFALLFWYISKRQDKLSDAVHKYEEMFAVHKLALKPTPDFHGAPENVYDLRFQLLKYYSDNSYHVTHLFNTFTHTNDPLDYRLSWFVFQTLHALQQEEAGLRARNHMHISFSAQLEQMGLWHWAVFILTFLTNNRLKRLLIEDMLGRHVLLQYEETPDYRPREKMLIEKFRISGEWLDKQKGFKAYQSKYYRDAYHHFCYAREWLKANEILVEHYAPPYLVSYDYEYLIDLLAPLYNHKEMLPNWEEAGGLILDFAKLGAQYNTILSLRDPIQIKKHLINFRSAVINISVRFKDFVPTTYLHDVCLAEMSGRIAVMLRKLLTIINGHTYELSVDTAINAQTLPMTTDYLKQELNSILIDFLNGNQPRMIYL